MQDAGSSVVMLGEDRRRAGGEGEEIPKLLALQLDKVQR